MVDPQQLEERRAWRRTVAASTTSVVVSATPVFMLAATASLVRADIPLSASQLGLAISGFFVVSAIVSRPSGTFCHRLGPRRAMGVAALVTALATLAMAASGTLVQLSVALAVSGVGNGISAPASNLALVDLSKAGRSGLAFGVKQAALPISTMFAGLAVPLIAVPFGWRTAIASCAVFALLYLALPYRDSGPMPLVVSARDKVRAELRGVVWLAVAAGCASAAGTSMNSFYVEHVVDQGIAPDTAGLLLAMAGLLGAVARLGLGHWVDRRATPLKGLLVTLWLGGAIGAVLFGIGSSLRMIVLATAFGYCLGWAWNGIFHLGVVRRYPRRAGVASGTVSVGIFVGGSVGPAIIGSVITAAGTTPAWLLIGVFFIIAVVAIQISEVVAARVAGSDASARGDAG